MKPHSRLSRLDRRLVGLSALVAVASIASLLAGAGWTGGRPSAVPDQAGMANWLVFPPTLESLYGVDLSSPGTGLAVGRHGIAVAIQAGQIMTMPTETDRDLYGVDLVNPSEAVAVGASGLILRWKNGMWMTETDVGDYTLYDVAMKTAGEGWAVGQEGSIFHLQGGQWMAEDAPDPIVLYAVDIAPDGKVWAVGEQGEVLKRDDGEWLLVVDDLGLPIENTGIEWRSVDASQSNGLWVAGTLDEEGTPFGIVVRLQAAADGRIELFDRRLVAKAAPLHVAMTGQTAGWAVGKEGITLQFDGQGWSSPPSPDCFANLTNLDAIGNDAWAVGQSRGINTSAIWRSNPSIMPTETPEVMPTPTHDHHPERARRLTLPPKGERPLAALPPVQRTYYYDLPPVMEIDPKSEYTAVFETEVGNIRVALDAQHAPFTTNNFILLALNGFYDGLVFHRVIDRYIAQSGDTVGDGTGDPGYAFDDEFDCDLRFNAIGRLAMANAGPGTNGSQFFFSMREAPWLDGMHTIFGTVDGGQDNLFKIAVRSPSDMPARTATLIRRVLILPFDTELPTATPTPAEPTATLPGPTASPGTPTARPAGRETVVLPALRKEP